ncbi:hypothetical protein [Natronincola ferrireducens]|uniref:Uncharacterized protein n=1 Tax=Natronincola ferrireducens TaxID=393762 RepID=A0A1G9G6C4_9FIRM|nr:hypothetical protein [Natronincola ferrireducens]SDK96155.1 hypothetical protein SAMN05660472_02365 [Natronincola ferrireducens]
MAKFKKSSLFTIVIVLGVLVVIGQVVYASNKEPGSMEDPIVTRSYVEQRIEQLKFYIDEKLSSSQPSQPQPPVVEPSKGNKLDIVYLKTGEILIADEGTEIILRRGRAVVVDSPSGGIVNVTIGGDIKKNETIMPNHLHIVPRSDGRGVKALGDDVILMIRGSYRIEK